MSISAGEIVKLLKSDKDALRELSAAIASEPELRLAVINAVIADVATKQDLQQLRQELREEISQLRQEMRGEITATKQDIQQLRQELKGEMAQLRQEMKEEIAQLREELRGGHNSDKTRLPATKTGVERGDIAATGGDGHTAATRRQ
jgi:uncharacterized protein involved in exopolysaccharide biosynthesis